MRADGWATGSLRRYCSGGTGTYQVWIQCQSSVWPYWYSFKESSCTGQARDRPHDVRAHRIVRRGPA
jgi:hypothetical protein